ncbi:hypothetical protein PVAND_017135 [Polypedilum vanderplanki]|uniref:Uncharacterized protein n=1 Tax=Polypedilum vanderplanki TaxID=319348 RepID=A0A9J6BI84_POLVA|nr:hypothetical protein PVAND_017135 [Polypedilum vanderplanki]
MNVKVLILFICLISIIQNAKTQQRPQYQNNGSEFQGKQNQIGENPNYLPNEVSQRTDNRQQSKTTVNYINPGGAVEEINYTNGNTQINHFIRPSYGQYQNALPQCNINCYVLNRFGERRFMWEGGSKMQNAEECPEICDENGVTKTLSFVYRKTH